MRQPILSLAIALIATVAQAQQITGYEYWFDQDHQAREWVALTDPETDVVLSEAIPANGLPTGPHTIRYRLKDDAGRWSSVLSKPFRATYAGPHHIVLLRYWSDPATTDPSDMTEVPITSGVQYLDVVNDLLFCNWSTTGESFVYFQLKDNHAQWSAVIKDTIDVDLVIGPPPQPVPINGPFAPPFNSAQTYFIAPVSEAGAYEWTLPNGWTGSSTGPSITAQVGNFNDGSQLCVRASNGCGTSERTCLDISTGFRAQEDAGGIGVFPNPSTGQFTITANSPITRLAVYNSTGQLVREQNNPGIDRATLDLEDEAAGLYTVRVFQATEHTDMRVMLQ